MNTIQFFRFQHNYFLANEQKQSEPISIEEQIKKSCNDFETFRKEIERLLQSFENYSTCFTFIESVLKELNNDFFTKSSYSYWFLSHLPIPVIDKLLVSSPQLFAMQLECLTGQQSKNILKRVSKNIINWKTRLETAFKFLEKSENSREPLDQPAGRFVRNVIDSLQPYRRKQWIKFCARHLPFDDWAFFLLALDKRDQALVLKVIFKEIKFDLTIWGLTPFLNALAKQIAYPELVTFIYNKILHQFYRQNKFQIFLDQIHQLSYQAQISFLKLLSFSKLTQVVAHYQCNVDLLAKWIDSLFCEKIDYFYRRNLIVIFICNLDEPQFDDFLFYLAKVKSQVSGYFLTCLPFSNNQDTFNHHDHFIFQIPCEQRTELLANGCADHASQTLLSRIKDRHLNWVYDHVTINFNDSIISIEPNQAITLKMLVDQTIKYLNKEDESFMSVYSPLIQSIPPVLIGVLSNYPDLRDILLNLVEYLTDPQLKFLMASMKQSEICYAIDKIHPVLSPKQYRMILEFLPPRILSYFLNFKKEQLKECYVDFFNKFIILQQAIALVKEKEKISSDFFTEQLEIKQKIMALVRRPLMMDFQEIFLLLKKANHLDGKSKNTIKEIEGLKNTLEFYLPLIEGNQPLLTIQIEELEKKIDNRSLLDDVDLSESLYQNFWLLVRDKTLPYLDISPHSSLGITHAGELYLLGIRTNDDLEHLGISQEKQDFVEKSIGKFKIILENAISKVKFEEGLKKEIILNLRTFWNNFLEIKYNDDLIKENYAKIVNLLKMDKSQLKGIVLNLHNNLQNHCEFNTFVENQNLREKFTLNDDPENLLLLVENFLISMRNKHPLFCLQHYLTKNVELKKTWNRFHSMNCYSIEDLFRQNRVKSTEDLFALQKIN